MIIGISVQLACALAVSPEPSCKSYWNSPEVPLTEGQKGSVSLTSMFKGFNLSYSIKNSSNIWTIQQKLTIVGRAQAPDLAFVSAKQYQRGDAYSEEALLYSDDRSSIVYLSSLHKEQEVPGLKQLLLQDQLQTQCFDVQLLESGILLADCVTGNKSLLILANATDLTVIKRISGYQFADFGKVQKTQISSWKQGDRFILIRSYSASAVRFSQNNTYVELILLQGLEARTVRIIDRTFFGQKQLMIKRVAAKDGFLLILTQNSLLTLSIDIKWKANWLSLQPVTRPTFLSQLYRRANSMVFSVSLENQILVYQFTLTRPEDLVLIRRHSLVSEAATRSLHSSLSFTVLSLQKRSHKLIWVYTPQDRVYSLAFYVSPALYSNLTIFYYPRSNYLLKLASGTLELWALKEPKLNYKVSSVQQPETNATDQLTVQSTNGYDFVRCIKQIQILFLQSKKRYLINSRIEPPSVYQFNSPGQFYIRLDNYVKGPDINYSLQSTLVDDQLPRNWLLESNKTKISWDPFPPQNIQFIRKESWTVGLFQVFQIFVQNSSDFLHIYNCFGSLGNDLMDCSLQSVQKLSSQVRLFSWSRSLKNRIFCLNLQSEPNRLRIYQQESLISTIVTQEGKQGQIKDVKIVGSRLFLLMKFKKEIRVFNIPACQQNTCLPAIVLDYEFFYRQGFKYFSPKALQVNSRIENRVLILTDYETICVQMWGDDGRVATSVSEQITRSIEMYKAKLFKRFIVIAHKQLGVKVFNIQNQTNVQLNYNLPLYQFALSSQFLLEQSDFADQLFVTARTQDQQPYLLVYNLLNFATQALYKSYPLQGDSDYLQVSGHRVNFALTVDEGVNVVQIYEYPQIVVDSPQKSRSVNFVFSNQEKQVSRKTVRLQISNQPQKIIELNNVTGNKQLLKRLVVAADPKIPAGVYNFSDKRWWQGNILQYQVKAPDIPSLIQFQDHIHLTRNQPSAKGMTDFIATPIGGFVQQEKSLLYTGLNGSIQKIINIPSGTSCSLSLNYADIGLVSVCQYNDYQVLYFTTFSSSSGFVQGPFFTSAVSVNNIISCENLIMLLDQEGSVHIYEIEVDPDMELFSLIQIIDKQQLSAAQEYPGLSPIIVDISARSQNGLFTLLVTELAGFFRITFFHRQYSSQLTINSLAYVLFDKIIAPYNRKLPADAALISTYIHPNSTQDRLFLVIVCFDYDAFVGFLQLKDGTFDLKLVAKRYGNYWLQGKPRVQQNYLLVRLMSSPLTMQGSSQLVAIYDIDISTAKSYPQNRYFYGIKLGDRIQFNVLFNYSFSKKKINERGLVVLYKESSYLKQYRYSENLTIIVKNNSVSSQPLSIAALNDFSRIDFTIPLSLYSFYLETWQWVLLAFVTSLIVMLVVVAGIKWKQKKRQAMKIPLLQQSSESEDSQRQKSIFLQERVRQDLIQQWEGPQGSAIQSTTQQKENKHLQKEQINQFEKNQDIKALRPADGSQQRQPHRPQEVDIDQKDQSYPGQEERQGESMKGQQQVNQKQQEQENRCDIVDKKEEKDQKYQQDPHKEVDQNPLNTGEDQENQQQKQQNQEDNNQDQGQDQDQENQNQEIKIEENQNDKDQHQDQEIQDQEIMDEEQNKEDNDQNGGEDQQNVNQELTGEDNEEQNNEGKEDQIQDQEGQLNDDKEDQVNKDQEIQNQENQENNQEQDQQNNQEQDQQNNQEQDEQDQQNNQEQDEQDQQNNQEENQENNQQTEQAQSPIDNGQNNSVQQGEQ